MPDLLRRFGAWQADAAAPFGEPVVIAGWRLPGRIARQGGFRAGEVGCYLGGAPYEPQLMFPCLAYPQGDRCQA